jgi:hypothetical protein
VRLGQKVHILQAAAAAAKLFQWEKIMTKKNIKVSVLFISFASILMSSQPVFAGNNNSNPAPLPGTACPPDTKMYSCQDLYAAKIADALGLRPIWKFGVGWAGTGAALTAVVAPGAMVGVLAGAAAFSAYKSAVNSQTLKIEKLKDEDSKVMARLLKKLKKIDPEISAEKVQALMGYRFKDGTFCNNLPKYFGEKEIEGQIIEDVTASVAAKNMGSTSSEESRIGQ